MFLNKYLRLSLVLGVVTAISGCGATHTAINKRNLDTQTKMSSTIFLEPTIAANKKVFVQVRNTSDKSQLDLEREIECALQEKGYTVVRSPQQAHYLLQANILHVGRSDLRAADNALDQGFGAALGGGIVGAGVGSLAKRHHHDGGQGAIIGGLVGAAVSTVADAMIQDVIYTAIADIQVSERADKSVRVKEKTKSNLKQGTSGTKIITATEDVNWKRYQTRIVSTANKVNLKFEQAAPELMKGMSRSIAGIF